LENYHKIFASIPQLHYVGKKDKNITIELVENFVQDKSLIVVVDKASHNYGWENIIPKIISEN